jgi:hypothetical protein
VTDESPGINQRVSEWLATQGYPLELSVAKAFRAERFRVMQAEYYTDPESQSAREIDVVASMDARQSDYLFRVSFVVECKMSREKPWVLFTSDGPGLADPARVVQRASNRMGARLLRALAKENSMHGLALFHLHGPPCHGVTQAFTSGLDAAYAALLGSAKATKALALARGASRVPMLQLFFPLVVIEGRAFNYCLRDDGRATVDEVAEGTLLWRNPVVDVSHTIVDIVTVAGLSSYVTRAAAACQELFANGEAMCRSVIAAASTPQRRVRSPRGKWMDSWRD